MRVLVTGAFGYLGGRLCESLAQAGLGVVATGRSVPEGARAWAARFAPRTADLLDAGAAEALVAGVDAVVHLAALDENEAARDPERAMAVSATATRRLAAAARAAGARRFVFASTFHVYGPTAAGSIDERTPTRAAHPYSVAHLAGEGFCLAEHLRGGLATPILRLSNAYGAPVRLDVERWTLAHNDFCRQAVEHGRVELRSHGLQHRDLVWVEDVAQAVLAVLRAPDAALEDPVFDVGGARSMSVRALAELVAARAAERLGRAIPVTAPAPPPGRPPEPVRYGVARLAALGYVPRDALVVETDRILAMLDSQPSLTAP